MSRRNSGASTADPKMVELHDACRQGSLPQVENLIEEGVNTNLKDSAHMTALHYAAHRGHGEIVALLISNEADANAPNREGMLPMHHAAVGGYKHILEFLIDNINCNVFAQDNNGMTILHHAAYNNKFDVVMAAFERGIDLDSADTNGWTALMYGSQQGHIQMAALLLDLGADIHMANSVNKTAEQIAGAYNMHDLQMVLQRAEAEMEKDLAVYAPKPRRESKQEQVNQKRGTAIAFLQRRVSTAGAIMDEYDLLDMIGRGRQGVSVHRARHKVTGATRVIRTIPSSKYKDDEGLSRQIEVLKSTDHPNIVKLYGTYKEQTAMNIVTQYCSGGSVFDRLFQQDALTPFAESTTAKYFKQMLRATSFLHNQNVVHRDLRLETFLFLSPDPEAPLKISDFGLAARGDDADRFAGGNVYYMAPEMFHRAPDCGSDMWSLGVILYLMISGVYPFNAPTKMEVVTKIKKGDWTFDDEDEPTAKMAWESASRECKDLVCTLLEPKAADRIVAEDALKHRWFNLVSRRTVVANQSDLSNLKENFQKLANQQKLEKAVMGIAIRGQDEAQFKGLKQVFSALDTDQDGVLSYEEVARALELAEVSIEPEVASELDKLVSATGSISYTAFISAMSDRSLMLEDSTVSEAFNIFDRNGDGKLDFEELSKVMEAGPAQAALDNYGDGESMGVEQFKGLLANLARGR